MKLKDKKVAILGVGIEGVALAEYLQDKVSELFLLDNMSVENLKKGPHAQELKRILSYEGVRYKFGDDYLDHLREFDVVFRSPGISYNNAKLVEAREAGVEISSQIKLFFELCPSKIIGVTGTKGKGTTSTLIEKILKDSGISTYIAGNIGYPAITLLSELTSDDIVILELSSFQLMDLDKSPFIAVITNLLVDHLDYHKDIDEYLDAKLNIIRHQTKSNYAIVNHDVYTRFKSDFEMTGAHLDTFSGKENVSATALVKKEDAEDYALFLGNELVCRQSDLKILGKHNLENIAAAVLVTSILGVTLDKARESIRGFKGLPHRLEVVAEKNSVLFINDSFATNPLPTIAAIEAISQNKILILGGSSKGADFSELAEKIIESKVVGVVLIGVEGGKIKEALEHKNYDGKVLIGSDTMSNIVEEAMSLARPGDVIMLSPACASFGLFKDYKDRGDKFKQTVLKLTSERV